MHAHRLGQLDAGQVAVVARVLAERRGLLGGAAAEVDLEPGAGEADGEARAPRAGADDRRAADRRQPAEPLPLEHHARPDPIGDRAGERRRWRLDEREAQRAAGADPHLVRADPPAAADRLGADHRDRDDRRAGLEREPADAALGRAERAGPDPRALGEDQHDVPAREDRLGGLDHVAVAGAAVDRERAERVEDPRLPRAPNSSFLAT